MGGVWSLMRNNKNNQAYGLSLLFHPAARPVVEAIRELASEGGAFSVSHDPSLRNAEADQPHAEMPATEEVIWLELLADGLTFDLTGLGPAAPAQIAECVYRFDLPDDLDISELEAVCLTPGPHLAGGERLTPVVRAMVGLAAELCSLDALVAVAWHPARSCIGPRYFTSIVNNWLEGGVFPGLGLVGLADAVDGGMQSEGVAFFTGQELRIERELAEDRAAAAKIAVRLIDFLVEHGPFEDKAEVPGPDGRMLRIEPSANGRFVRVWNAG